MNMIRKKLGGAGEGVAAVFLQKQGYRILDTNVHTPYGELDIVALDSETLAFIEVKTRRGEQFGHPFDAVTAYKQKAIIKSSLEYIHKNNYFDFEYRFDVVGFCFNSPFDTKIELIKNAFEFEL